MHYFEDFHIGDTFELGPLTVTAEEIIAFAKQFDPQYFHVDPQRAKDSIFGGLVASGWHAGALFMRMFFDDVLSKTADLSKTLRRVPADEAIILLAHEPDFADQAAKFPIDLQLSGHSHGGQIRVPLLPPLYLPAMARKYVWGTYHVGPRMLYTNAGLGTIGVPMRLNCPPEITLLTLRRAV